MVTVGRIVLVGTSHIAKESVKNVREVIENVKPVVVAIELDRLRFSSLLSKKKASLSFRDVFRVGLKGWLFAALGSWFENSLGKKVGVRPGADMLAGVYAARSVGARVALIDQDISVTLKRLSGVSWREKWRFFKELVLGFFGKSKVASFDLSKVPAESIIESMIEDVRKSYPTAYRVLIHERNVVMSRNLVRLLNEFSEGVIVAVVGAGHVKEMAVLLKKYLKTENSVD